jgi:uncharacterized membrane protein YqjE
MIERIPKLFLQILHNRLELFTLELQEEKIRLHQSIVLTILGAFLGFTGIAGLGILIIWLVPPESRVLTASIVIAVFLITSLSLLAIARRRTRRHSPFESTLAMLDKDIYQR